MEGLSVLGVEIKGGRDYEDALTVIDEIENELVTEEQPCLVLLDMKTPITDEFAFGFVLEWHDSVCIPDYSVIRYAGDSESCAAMLLAMHRYRGLESADTDNAEEAL